jgi:methanogenic corrinoid protein MtbC1
MLDRERGALAEAITARQYELQPELIARYGEAGRARCLQDASYHLSYLSESVAATAPTLFADYVAWAQVMLETRGVPAADLARNLEVMRGILQQQLAPELAAVASEYLESGMQQLSLPQASAPSALREHEAPHPLTSLAQEYLDALMRGERHVASRLVLEAVEGGTSVKDVYLRVFQAAQHEIGRLWQMNRLSVAQEHYCTAATQLIMSQLYPHIFAGEKNGHTLVATCVSGDLHEIGVRMVSDFFEMEGWDTFYLGANVPAQSIVQTLIERRADVLAVSATMTYHVRAVKHLISVVRSSELCRETKILVGGYPFNLAPELWREVGADACARDAAQAISLANQFVGAEGTSLNR